MKLNSGELMPRLIELSLYLPILSTLISAAFAWAILARYSLKRQSYHLLWWGIGIGTYGLGTLIESLVTLFGRRAGRIAVVLLLAAVSVTSIFVVLSPVRTELVDPKMLSGKALAWQSIRRVSPFINSLAVL